MIKTVSEVPHKRSISHQQKMKGLPHSPSAFKRLALNSKFPAENSGLKTLVCNQASKCATLLGTPDKCDQYKIAFLGLWRCEKNYIRTWPVLPQSTHQESFVWGIRTISIVIFQTVCKLFYYKLTVGLSLTGKSFTLNSSTLSARH